MLGVCVHVYYIAFTGTTTELSQNCMTRAGRRFAEYRRSTFNDKFRLGRMHGQSQMYINRSVSARRHSELRSCVEVEVDVLGSRP